MVAAIMRTRTLAVCALIFGFTSTSLAQPASLGPTRIIVPFTPGGFPDRVARLLANEMSARRPAPVIVENKPGAGGVPGALYVSRAEPDGSVLLMGTLPTLIVSPLVSGRSDFDPVHGFSHLAYIGGPPNAFVVPTTSPISSLASLIERSRKEPLRYGTAGVGSMGHLNVAFVAKKDNVEFIHVPYNGPMINDILAGSVDFGSLTASTVLGQIDGGLLRAIAFGTERRLARYPDVPTFKELGYDIDPIAWQMLSGPPNMPTALREAINKEISSILSEPGIKEAMRRELIDPIAMTPAEAVNFVAAENDSWSRLITSMGILGSAR